MSEPDLLYWVRLLTNIGRTLAYVFLVWGMYRYARDRHPPGRNACLALAYLFVASTILAAARTAMASMNAGYDWLPYIDIAVSGVTFVAVFRIAGDLRRVAR